VSVHQELDTFLGEVALLVTAPKKREPVVARSGRPPLTMGVTAGNLAPGDFVIGRGTVQRVCGQRLMIVRCSDGVRLIPRDEVVQIHLEDDGQDG